MNLMVLASGRGSDFQSIVDHIELRVLEGARVNLLVCNRAGALVLERARKLGVQAVVIEGIHGEKFSSREDKEKARLAFDENCLSLIEKYHIDLSLLAGFDQLVSDTFVEAFPNRIMNIHPAYDLIKFGGKSMIGPKVHDLVIKTGARYSGCTVHFVTKLTDQGPAIIKKRVKVRPDDTPQSLESRILLWEHLVYPEAIQLFVDGRVILDESGTRCFVDRLSNNWELEWTQRQQAYIESHNEMKEIVSEL